MLRRLPHAVSSEFPDPTGLPLPSGGIRGLRILLASPDPAAIHDAFLASALVGATGSVDCWLDEQQQQGQGGQQQGHQLQQLLDEPAAGQQSNSCEGLPPAPLQQHQQQPPPHHYKQKQQQQLSDGECNNDDASSGSILCRAAASAGVDDNRAAAADADCDTNRFGTAAAATGRHEGDRGDDKDSMPTRYQPQRAVADAVAVANGQLAEWAAALHAPSPGNLTFSLRSLATHPLPAEAFHLAAVSGLPLASPDDLAAVLRGLHGTLRAGGELFVSALLSGRRLGSGDDPAAEALLEATGAGPVMYAGDFVRELRSAGFTQPRVQRVEAWDPAAVDDEGAQFLMLNARVSLVQIRAQKNRLLEPSCEDYGQWVVYKGTVEGCDEAYTLDSRHKIPRNQPTLVCGNTAAMLGEEGVSWLSEHFVVSGDRSVHYGAFSGGGLTLQPGGGGGQLSERCCICW